MSRPEEMREVTEAIERLEARNRRLHWLILISWVTIISLAATGARPDQRPSEVIEATGFHLVDSEGNLLGTWNSSFGEPQLAMISPLSDAVASLTPQVLSLSAADDMVEGALFGKQFADDSTATGIRIAGRHGEMRFAALKEGPSLELRDSTGVARVIAGTTRLTRSSGSTEITAPGSILLLNSERRVVWRAPR